MACVTGRDDDEPLSSAAALAGTAVGLQEGATVAAAPPPSLDGPADAASNARWSRVHAPKVVLPSVSGCSPLGQRLQSTLEPFARLSFGDGARPDGRAWRRAAGRTLLRWWDDEASPAPGSDARAAADVTIDLHGTREPGPGITWRVVDAAGAPLLQAFHGLHGCHRAPWTASLHVVETSLDDPDGRVIAEAHVSSVAPYGGLLDTLGATAATMLRRAVQARFPSEQGPVLAPPRRWTPATPPAPRAWPIARAHVASKAHWLRSRLGGDTYGIARLRQSPESFLSSAVLSPARWLQVPAKQGFVADPFFWPGRPGVVLCEAYSHQTGLGRIAAFALDQPGNSVDSFDVLRTGRHLSYPFAWIEDGRAFCLPEMAAERRQVLFELGDDGAARPVCVVADDVAMADPTLMRHDGLYWIYYSDGDIGTYDTLCLLFAERLGGPWRRHPGNPVKVDVRSSRPGGTPFQVAGRLFRPAQDCSKAYGSALAINHVVRCSPSDYAEETVAKLLPDPSGPFPDGLHTLAVEGDQALIDGKRVSYHPIIALQKLKRRAKMLVTGN